MSGFSRGKVFASELPKNCNNLNLSAVARLACRPPLVSMGIQYRQGANNGVQRKANQKDIGALHVLSKLKHSE